METVPSVALAREFARSFGGDFDATLHVDCATGTLADMAGDLAWQVGLRLDGELSDNLEHLRVFCAARRFLVVLEGGAPADLIFGGRCSTLIATEARRAIPGSLCANWRATSMPWRIGPTPAAWRARSAGSRTISSAWPNASKS